MTKNQSHEFRADVIGPLPQTLSADKVRSSTHYLIMAHLVRPLVRLNKTAQIEGDLADSWEISPDFKTYRFAINEKAAWSDGSPITASEIAEGFNRLLKLGSTTHFDFRIIDRVATENSTLTIELHAPNPNFLQQLVHPEVSAVKWDQGGHSQQFDITSGAYSLASLDQDSIVLQKNRFFPWAHQTSPETIRISASSDVSTQVERLINREVDFVVPATGMTMKLYDNLIANKSFQVIDPHIGYTFWLAPNSSKAEFKSKSKRLWLSRVVRGLSIDFEKHAPYWSPARQLYLNDGFGRPTTQELDEAWKAIESAPGTGVAELKLLVAVNFPFTEELRTALAKVNCKLITIVYKDIAQFESLLHEGNYDALQINNDFSSSDILENLQVTFSDSRPLVVAGNQSDEYKRLLSHARSTQDMQTKHSILKQIGLQVLTEGHVIPVAYRSSLLFSNKDWDFSRWSLLYPDIRFWKIGNPRQ